MRAVFAAFLSLFLPLAAAAQGIGPPAGRLVANPELTAVLAGGHEVFVEGVTPDKVPPIFLRLHAVGVRGTCAGRRETCGFRYYLALQDDLDPPNRSVIDLGALGEITKAELLTTDGGPPARLRLTVANYPSWIFEYAGAPAKREAVYTIGLDTDSPRVSRAGPPLATPDPLRPRPVRDPLMVRVLNDAAALDIDGVDDEGEPPPILPRLYAVPEEGSCPAGHDGDVCGARHFLALTVGAAGGRPPRLALFDLGVLGEVTQARLVSTGGGLPRLVTTVLNHPSWMFDADDPPAREEARYDI
ncbi:MAG TPA: hypothetical protein VFQ39_03410, partial [Longimicrobium sp.]|nr:hypothetical protein [Longimicrobium sp.]